MKTIFSILVSLSFVCIGYTQSVRFFETSLDRAIRIAQDQNKPIFIDTYAPWCIPCKRMEKVFRKREVHEYFNQNFVNVRIDMDGPYGKILQSKYAVVFLPTFLFLDQDGNLKHRSEGEISAADLLNLGTLAVKPMEKTAAVVNSSPWERSNEKTTNKTPAVEYEAQQEIKNNVAVPDINIEDIESDEKVLHVLGGSNANPEYLLKEAYFRLQLMDGSHRDVAAAYLKTQDNWNTETNIKFIYDFIYTSQSPEFDFFINNKDRFVEQYGEAEVRRTLEIIVYNRLQSGYPRPDLNEAEILYSYLNPSVARLNAFEYILSGAYEKRDREIFNDAALKYLLEVNPKDDEVIFRMIDLRMDQQEEKQSVENNIIWMKKAIQINANFPKYHLLLAKLYIIKGNKSEAKSAAENAIDLYRKLELDPTPARALISEIEAL